MRVHPGEALAAGLRSGVLLAARSRGVQAAVTRAPVSRSVVARFVAGPDLASALRTATDLAATGLTVSLDHLGEDTTTAASAEAAVVAYEQLLAALPGAGLSGTVEVSVKLTALGSRLDPELALSGASRICSAARAVATTVTLDMEGSDTTDATLQALRELRSDFPDLGAVLQAYLRRSVEDCRELATEGSRVRLCKGAYAEPERVAFTSPAQVRASYLRCLEVLMAGPGRPMVATHDPQLIDAAGTMAAGYGRTATSWEYQMLLGVRPEEQVRLAAAGHPVRVYAPYGAQWYGYLMRRLAERPANLMFFARALRSRS